MFLLSILFGLTKEYMQYKKCEARTTSISVILTSEVFALNQSLCAAMQNQIGHFGSYEL